MAVTFFDVILEVVDVDVQQRQAAAGPRVARDGLVQKVLEINREWTIN